jgi:sterol desaturase/sphingolipid hydroxylase (fatty acid hydroxylase superfamily)
VCHPAARMAATAQLRTDAVARGRALKRVNAMAAVLCGFVPAVLLAVISPPSPQMWLFGFLAGLVWANFFEYGYHRYLLHLPGTFFALRHLVHHASVGEPAEAEHVNLGGSPLWVAALFVINGLPVVAVDLLLGLRISPGVLIGFAFYFLVVEEFHWRIHLGEQLPPGLRFARYYHLAHHDHPDGRFNIFLPLWDKLLGTASECSRATPSR